MPEEIPDSLRGSRRVESDTAGRVTAVSAHDWSERYAYDGFGFRPAAQRRRTWADDADQNRIDEAFHAIVTDLVGTPTELVVPDGHIAWHTTASVWGRTIAASAEPNVDCPLRFPGQYYDAETGLHSNGGGRTFGWRIRGT